jgi:hypothetical protein|eukprot:COSAG01_NODE_259_length_20069_cov_21.507762_17_plen_48_part_00
MHQLSRTHGADARFTASLPHAQPMLQVCVPGSAEWTRVWGGTRGSIH